MPIQASCEQCGKTVSAPDSAAGKVGKCPQCGGQIRVPAAAAVAVAAGPPPLPAAARPAPAPVATSAPVDDDDDGFRVRPLEAAEARCPGCGAALGHSAVICIQCGYNRKTGRTALTAAEEQAEKKKRNKNDDYQYVSEPDDANDRPWWVYAVLLGGLVVACIAAKTLPSKYSWIPGAAVIVLGLAKIIAGFLSRSAIRFRQRKSSLLNLILPFFGFFLVHRHTEEEAEELEGPQEAIKYGILIVLAGVTVLFLGKP